MKKRLSCLFILIISLFNSISLVNANITYFPNAFIMATDILNVRTTKKFGLPSIDNLLQNNLNKFLYQEQSIGIIGRYNHKNLTNPYRIGPIPSTRQEWQMWNMINSKLGKYFER